MTAVVLNKTECNLLKEILNLNTDLPISNMIDNNNNDYDEKSKSIDDDNNNNIENNEEFKFIIKEKLKYNTDLDLVSLKYLFKLLKFYKLEHYMSDLIDYGFYTATSLNELNNYYFEKLNVSAYDLKKFSKLQAFIKQVMSTLRTNKPTIASKMKQQQQPPQQQQTKSTKFTSSTSTLTSTPTATSSSSSSNNIPIWETKTNKNKIVNQQLQQQQKSNLNKRPNMKNSVQQLNVNNNNNNNNNKRILRSKSVEPSNVDEISDNAKITPSVCHPAPLTYISQKYKKSKNSYFGPQLKSNQIEHVEMKNYNYGVPNRQQDNNKKSNHRSSSTSNGGKQRKLTQNNENLLSGESNFEMADIYVFARKRPKLACELKLNDVVFVEDQNIVINQAKSAVDGTDILRQNEFTFDRIFDSSLSNEDIYNSSVLPFIEDPNNRIDFSCICFGQTGSGKTHTLFGSKSHEGICLMTVETLFSQNERLLCGFYEIYNGQLYDLFNQNSRLVLREDSNGLVNVVGLVEMQIKSIAQLKKAIETGQTNRHIGCTSFNKASSRSHAVLQIRVVNNSIPLNQIHRPHTAHAGGLSTPKTNNKSFRVLFIDLAGSERGIDAQNNDKDNRKEGAEINQSLLALKECIRCIDQFQTHAPFRQSKLTRVLRDCFIGCSRTVLIATVSPTDDSVQYSLNTLQYANRVRQMTIRGKKKYEKTLKLRSLSTNTKTNFIKNDLNSNQIGLNNIKPNNDNENNLFIVSASSRKLLSENKHNNQENNQIKTNFNSVNNKSSNMAAVLLEFENPKFKVSGVNDDNLKSIKQTILTEQQINSNKDLNSFQSSSNQYNNQPSLFHPSKINMSSTPIKANRLDKKIENLDESLLNDDIPIKGHKVKQSNLIVEEKYVVTTTANTSNAESHQLQQQQPKQFIENNFLNEKISNLIDDDKHESPKLSENNKIQNGSIETNDKEKRRSSISEKYLRRFSHLYSPLSSNNSSFAGEKEEFKSATNKLNNENEFLDNKKKIFTNSNSLMDNESSNNYRQNMNNNNELSDDKSSNHDKSFEAQNQLKFYIQSLEKKLANLRTEMKDSSIMSQTNSHILKKLDNNNRSLFKETLLKHYDSDESIDSMKEIVNQNYLKRNNENENNNNNCVNNINEYLGNNEPKLLLSSLDRKFMTPNLSPASTFAESSDDSHGSPDSEALKKSLHKNDGNDGLFDRVKAVTANLASSSSFSNHQSFNNNNNTNTQFSKFTPISKNKFDKILDNSRSETSLSTKDENIPIKLPIPIRYNSSTKTGTTTTSSSADSTSQIKSNFDKFESIEKSDFKCLSLDGINNNQANFNNDRLQNGLLNRQNENVIENKNNEMWKGSNNLIKENASNELKTSLVSNNSISKSEFSTNLINKNNKHNDVSLQYALISMGSNSFKDTASNFRRANTLNSNTVSPHTLQRTRSLLVVAHENQLSDITETCKEEMGLLMSFKDSQMDFGEYLDKVEQMLTKKALSIRDLQQQINHLKTINKVTPISIHTK